MKKKTPHDSHAIVHEKKFNKIRVRSIIGFVLLGIIIGIIPNFFGMSKIFNKTKQPIPNTATVYCNGKHGNTFAKFTKPFIPTPDYSDIYQQDLNNFKKLAEAYCQEAKKDKSIEQISFYYRDLTDDQWFGINENEKYIPASLAKVPIMIAVLQKAEKDPSYLTKKLVFKGSFTSRFLKAHPMIDDVRTDMVEEESYSIETLVKLMITKSDNEAAMMLYDDFGMAHWDALQKKLGNTVPIGAPLNKNILTVKSYSSFFRMLYNSSILTREYSEKALEILSQSEYDKGIRLAVPSNILVCHKYGERDSSISETENQIQQLHHAGIVYFPGKTYFVCIMTKGSDKAKMQTILYDLSKIAYDQVKKQAEDFEKPALAEDLK